MELATLFAAGVWGALVLRITLGLAVSTLAVALILRRWPEVSAAWRHRLWCGVLAQGLLWFTIPWTLTETVAAPRMPAASAEMRVADLAGTGPDFGPQTHEHELAAALSGGSARAPAFRVSWAMVARSALFAWLAGVTILASSIAVRYVRFRRRLARESRLASESLQQACALQALRLEVKRTPAVRVASCCDAPFVFGLLRPTIYLPETLAEGEWSHAGERDTLLAHELAHAARADAWIEAMALSACVLNFFNPAAWIARRQLAAAREQCADEAVVLAGRHSPGVYARALLHVAERLSLGADRIGSQALALSTGRSASELRQRIESLLLDAARTPDVRRGLFPARLGMAALVLATGGSLITVHRQTLAAEEPAVLQTASSSVSRPVDQLALADTQPKPVLKAVPYRHEEMVKGVKFLASLQREDGSLGDDGHGQNVGAVSLVGLAFLASGSKSTAGEHREQMVRCLEFVEKHVSDNGYIASSKSGSMYDHGFATLFLARAYPMTPDRKDLKGTIEKAVKVIVSSQGHDGGWRYQPLPAIGGDLTVGACQITALEAARVAGFLVPNKAFEGFAGFLRSAITEEGSYRYTLGGGGGSPARTGAGLYAGYLSGASDEDRKLSLKCLQSQKAPLEAGFRMYGQWYASQVMRRVGGEPAAAWYRTASAEVCERQDKEGSWKEMDSQILGTALGCLILASPVFEAVGTK